MRVIEIFEAEICFLLTPPYDADYRAWLDKVNAQSDLTVIYQPLNLLNTSGVSERLHSDYLVTSAMEQRSNGMGMFWNEQSPNINIPDIISKWNNKLTYKVVGTDLQITCTISNADGCNAGNKLVIAMIDTSDQFKNWVRKYLKSEWYDETINPATGFGEWKIWIDIPALKPFNADDPTTIFTYTFTEPIEKTLNGFTFSDSFKLIPMVQDFTEQNDAGLPNQPDTQHWVYDRAILDVGEGVDVTNAVITPVQPPVVTPAVPANIHIAVAPKFVAVTWTPIAGLSYRINYRVKGTQTWATVNGGAGRKILALTSKTSYELQIEAVGKTVTSQWSAIQTFTTK